MLKRRMGDITTLYPKPKATLLNMAPCPLWNNWDSRFHSTLIEGSETSLSTILAYIDINPVRAGIVDDPKDYKWSGYDSALSGDNDAMLGIARIYSPDAKISSLKKA